MRFYSPHNNKANEVEEGGVLLTKELATLLVLAQAASDEGKRIYSLSSCLQPNLRRKAEAGYPAKDKAIAQALSLVAKYHTNDVHYYVICDAEGKAKYLVYFDLNIGGKRRQISFHSFDDNLEKFIKKNERSHTEWDQGDCRAVAFEIAKKFRLLQ